VRRFTEESRRTSTATSPYTKDDNNQEIELEWEKGVSIALSAGENDFNTVSMPPTRMSAGPLERRIRVVRIEATVCLVKHGKGGLVVPYDQVFGDASVCRDHPNELSMLSVVLTRWEPEASVPHMPLQLIVQSTKHADCCGGTETPREWTNPRHARVVCLTRGDDGKDTVSTHTCRRLIGEDRLPLSLFEASAKQSTEAHISEQTALSSGLHRPFAAAGGVYHIPTPFTLNAHNPDKKRHRAFVTDYNASRLCVAHPNMIAPKAQSLTVVDDHIVVSTSALQAVNDCFRRKHSDEKQCTVVPHTDILVRITPSHSGGEMDRYVDAAAAAGRNLFVSIGLEFWVVVGGEPKYDADAMRKKKQKKKKSPKGAEDSLEDLLEQD
jgi:hypothetical protein